VDIFLVRRSALYNASDDVAESAHFLSVEGRQWVRAVSSRVKQDEAPELSAILTSPSAACVQTAELFADRVDYLGAITVLPGLAGDVPAKVLGAQISARAAHVAVVADEPALSALGAFLIGRPSFPLSLPGQVCLLRDHQPEWYWRPDAMVRAPLLVA
jgi:phosphohistidine phosphatase SixA